MINRWPFRESNRSRSALSDRGCYLLRSDAKRAAEILVMRLILRCAAHKLKFCKCLIGMLPSGSFPGGSQSVPLIKSTSNASLFMTRKEGRKKTLMH
jgi:hypothetical protein